MIKRARVAVAGWATTRRPWCRALRSTARNLVENPNTKKQSKLNALSTPDKVAMAPLGYLAHLGSQKVAHLNLEAQGWGTMPVSLDVLLQVHDPSGAAGVNIDLVRIAASARRHGRGGYLAGANPLLKSPPGKAI